MDTNWCPDLTRYAGPRYRALAEAIAEAVETEALVPGDRLPTHRALADALGVTVGTVTRGYAEAERRGLVHGQVGSGTYVRPIDGNGVEDFALKPEGAGDGHVDFGLAFPVPGRRGPTLADALRGIADDPRALQACLSYQPEAGLPRHREVLADWLRGWGVELAAEETLLTLGGLHGVYLTLSALARAGETVASAGLVYPGLIAAARGLGLRHVPVELDEHGIVPEALESACRQHGVRLVYVTPDQNNPTTVCLPRSRRHALLEIAQRYGITVIEDAVHLVQRDERPPALMDLAPENVVYVTSVSKILAGGLRVGVVRAPRRLIGPLSQALRGQCWMTPPLNAEVACRWIASGAADELARWQREEIGARQALVAERLEGLDFRARPYGFNVWLTLPEPWRAAEFVHACAAAGVVVKGGEPFAVGRYPVPQAVRLAITAPPQRGDVRRGLDLIRGVLARGPAGASATL